ncbi:unnamed protein product [Cuscuta epithymum]|uniref:F-box domain-containing protein n=1 Tax=Cuscuta epithymum TaxID=186058 RepID=A0AAV0EIS6_9ASTE|nr:unnamed protein product [Cuscuta epithymum]CAH9124077.1 unnamed protein product [Cuscuta epithymum]
MVRRRDRLSELPADLLDKILGCLPISDAARLAVLSSLWRDAWFNLTTLNFDDDFYCQVRDKYHGDYCCSDARTQKLLYENDNIDISFSMSLHVINKVLIQHNGPIHKFCFAFGDDGIGSLKFRVLDMYQWLTFVTQKGVEEIHLKFEKEDEFLLPNCIFSCPTLRRLRLFGSSYDTVDAPRNLPNFTSLYFEYVSFEPSGHAINAPMLENLTFFACDESMFHFNITAPKLGMLTIQGCSYRQRNGYLPINYASWESVCTLVLDGYSIKNFFEPFTTRGLPLQPPLLLNVEYLMLRDDPLECDLFGDYPVEGDISPTFIHLLRLCPNLRKLHIDVSIMEVLGDCLGKNSKRSKHLYHVAGRLHLLHTMILADVSYTSCCESKTWLSVIKVFLACFPQLQKFVIGKHFNLQTTKKILLFPRASSKVKIVFI